MIIIQHKESGLIGDLTHQFGVPDNVGEHYGSELSGWFRHRLTSMG